MAKKVLFNCSFSKSPNNETEGFNGVTAKKIKKEIKKFLKKFKKCNSHDQLKIEIIKLNPIKKSKSGKGFTGLQG